MPIPRPPRITGNPKEDSTAQTNWMFEVYKSTELQQEFVKTAEAFAPADFDASTLPDPASSSIPQAQDTANQAFAIAAIAYGMALANKAKLDSWIFGSVTVTGIATTGVATFAAAQADASYSLVVSQVAAAGTPDAGASRITGIVKTASGFTITVAVAPGVGNSVTYEYHLRR